MKVPVVNAGRPIVFVAGVLWIVSFAISTSSLRAQEYEIYKQLSGTGATDPRGPLIQGPDGLYGTSFTGGSGECDPQGGLPGCGTIYRLEPDGDVKVLHEFQVGEGRPTIYPLLRASDGNLYGTTIGSSFSCPCGTVYRLDPEGNFDTIHTFQGDDGRNPSSGLIEPVDGELWGTTTGGGTSTACTLGCGTVYRMHFDGGFTTMHSLDEADDEGRSPTGNLVLANLSGHDSHGIGMVPRYVDAAAEGGLKPNSGVRVQLDTGSLLTLDGQRGYGQIVGVQAMQMGIERAKAHGSCIMTLGNAQKL